MPERHDDRGGEQPQRHQPQGPAAEQRQPERAQQVEERLVVERPAHVERGISEVGRIRVGLRQEGQRGQQHTARHRIEPGRMQDRHQPVRRPQAEGALDEERAGRLGAFRSEDRHPGNDEAADDEEDVHADVPALDHVLGQPGERGQVGMGQRQAGMEDHHVQRGEAPQCLDALERSGRTVHAG